MVREPLVCVRTAGRSVLGQVSGLGVLGARDGAANEDVCPLLLAHSTAAGTLQMGACFFPALTTVPRAWT